jgi:hypothetical protein
MLEYHVSVSKNIAIVAKPYKNLTIFWHHYTMLKNLKGRNVFFINKLWRKITMKAQECESSG